MGKKLGIIFLLFLSIFIYSQEIVVSTTWVGALAELAGVEEYYTLTPTTLLHPTEYSLTVEDIQKIYNADYILFAGYENMVKEIKDGLNLADEKIIIIPTFNDQERVESSVLKIAQTLGNISVANSNLAELDAVYEQFKQFANDENLGNLNVAIQFHHQPMAKILGITPSQIFGPGPLVANDLQKAVELEIDLIIDNYHNPAGAGLLEVLPKAKRVLLMNFPGQQGTDTLESVLEYNLQKLKAELK